MNNLRKTQPCQGQRIPSRASKPNPATSTIKRPIPFTADRVLFQGGFSVSDIARLTIKLPKENRTMKIPIRCRNL